MDRAAVFMADDIVLNGETLYGGERRKAERSSFFWPNA
jgi:hypothetical protein